MEEVESLDRQQYLGDSYRASAMPLTDANHARPVLPRLQTQLHMSKQRHKTLSDESSLLAVQESYMNLAKALDMADFYSMREKQVHQRNRFLTWEAKLQNEIRAVHTRRKEDIHNTFDTQRDVLEEQVGHDQLYDISRTDVVSAHGRHRRC